MAFGLFNLVGVVTGTTGQGDIALGSAITGFANFADGGVTNGDEVRYLIKDGDNQEVGLGTYNSSGPVMSRDTVNRSIISGTAGTTKLTLSGTATVYLTLASQDLSALVAFSRSVALPSADGAADAVLTTDGAGNASWAAAGGGGGMVPIGAPIVASADSAVDIELTGGYPAYLVRFSEVRPSSNGADLQARISDDDAVSYETTNYAYAGLYAYSSNTVNYSNSTSAVRMTDAQYYLSRGATGDIVITPANGTEITYFKSSAAYYRSVSSIVGHMTANGYHTGTTAVTHLRFMFSAGNITKGRFQLYGLAEGTA